MTNSPGADDKAESVPTQSSPVNFSPDATVSPRLPASIYVIGLVSMLNDVATEMVTPLIPILLATVLVSGPVVLGLVKGLANAVACVLQIWAGRLSDATGGRRKPLAVSGYLLSNVMRPLLALATVWWHVVAIRAFDRVGKGIRGSPRLAFGVPEPVKKMAVVPMRFRLQWHDVQQRARGYLLTVMLFTFARVAEMFIVLRAHELGASIVHALLLWAALNFVKIFANYAAGVWADRHGRVSLLVPGWLLQSFAMLGFCFVSSIAALWLAALFFGVAMSVSEGVERAVIGDFADPAARGTLFGWYYALVGVASIPAGLMLGGLWQVFGPSIAYAFAGLAGFLAAGLLHFKIAPQLAKSPFVTHRQRA